jgi:starch synthase
LAISEKTVLMVTFEAVPFVKVGGLAEVPSNLARGLADLGWKAYVALPSHASPGSRGEEIIDKLSTPYGDVYVGAASWCNVMFLLFSGSVLSNASVYAEEVMESKVKVFTRSLALFLSRADSLTGAFPSIIHFHDWHSVYSLVALKHALAGKSWRSVFHIHLLVRRKVRPEVLSEIGVPLSWVHEVSIDGRREIASLEEVLSRANFIAEKVGAMEADRLVTVSRAYLSDEVLPFLGHGYSEKSRVIYNATDWSLVSAQEEALRHHKPGIIEFFGEECMYRRVCLRRYFLLKGIARLGKEEPVIPDERIRRVVQDAFLPPLREDGKPEPFLLDGPLAITTGRLAKQKGFDLMIEAVPRVLREIGNAKFVFLVIPVWGGEEHVYQLSELQRSYPENVRVIFGVTPSIYKLAHLASDIFFAPSRWEPFGIMALEAMATGNPLVASRTGGLKEIVLDVNEHGERGTGLLVAPGDPYELSDALRDLLAFMEASNTGDLDWYSRKIGSEKLLRVLEEYPDAGEILRKNCIERVERYFRWSVSANTASNIYTELLAQFPSG